MVGYLHGRSTGVTADLQGKSAGTTNLFHGLIYNFRPDDFIDLEYLPAGFEIREPLKCKMDAMERLIGHW